MGNRIFIRLDADKVGDKIELMLINSNFIEAQRIHDNIQESMNKLRNSIIDLPTAEILMYGSDDILFTIENDSFSISILTKIRTDFFDFTKSTLSIGVGFNLSDANLNLRIAKLSGRNKIVGIIQNIV